MHPDRTTPTARRRPLRALAAVATAIVVSLALPPVAAQADEPAGDTVVGTIVQAWPEADPEEQSGGHSAGEHAAEAPLTWVRTDAGESVRVPTEEVEGLTVGSTVELTVGEQLADAAGDDGYEPVRDVLTAEVLEEADPATGAARTASLTNQVTVAMVVPAGGTADGTALRDVVAAIDGPVAQFWADETGGAIDLGVTGSTDWIRTSAGCSDPTALWDEVAARTGFEPGPGRHLAVYLSSAPWELPGCSYALGELGWGPGAGGRLYVRDVLPSLIAHELGHNFGLGHSSGLQCDGAVETGRCRTAAYRDYYDVMGASWDRVGALTAPQAARLGVLPASAQVGLAADGAGATVTLAPLAGRTGTRAVRLTDPEGATYWLELRAATGRDGWLGSAGNRFGLDTGVLLHRSGGLPDTALLLDGTPAPAARWDGDLQAALPVGVPVPVSGGDLTVTVDAVTATGATVTVTTAAGDAVPTTPLPEQPGRPTVLAGSAAPASTVGPTAGTAGAAGTAGTGATAGPAVTAGTTEAGTTGAETAAAPGLVVVAPDAGGPAPGGAGAMAVSTASATTTGPGPALPVLAAAALAAVVLAGWRVARLRLRLRP